MYRQRSVFELSRGGLLVARDREPMRVLFHGNALLGHRGQFGIVRQLAQVDFDAFRYRCTLRIDNCRMSGRSGAPEMHFATTP